MRREEETGVRIESAIETGWACTTCGQFSGYEYEPCGHCVAKDEPARRAALQWAVSTLISFHPSDPRIVQARTRPTDERMWEGLSELRWEALATFAHPYQAYHLILALVRQGGWGEGEVVVDLSLAEKEITITMPKAPVSWSYTIDVDLVHLFVHVLLGVLGGPRTAGEALSLFDRHGARTVPMNAWPILSMYDKKVVALNPWSALMLGALCSRWNHDGHPKPCSGCRLQPAPDDGDWCSLCREMWWARKCSDGARSVAEAAGWVRIFGLPKSTDLPLPPPSPDQLAITLELMWTREDMLRGRLATALASRGWGGDALVPADGIVTWYGPNFWFTAPDGNEVVWVCSTQQAARLLPTLTLIPWYLPDATVRCVRAIERAALLTQAERARKDRRRSRHAT